MHLSPSLMANPLYGLVVSLLALAAWFAIVFAVHHFIFPAVNFCLLAGLWLFMNILYDRYGKR